MDTTNNSPITHSNPAIAAAVARARARIAEQKAKLIAKQGTTPVASGWPFPTGTKPIETPTQVEQPKPQEPLEIAPSNTVNLVLPTAAALRRDITTLRWNDQQAEAIQRALRGESFCLVGAAGTGKTTNLKGIIKQLLASNKLPPLEMGTKHLSQGAPGIVCISYTRRAVRNMEKQMPEDIKPHCITYHKLVEYAPEATEKEIFDEHGNFIEVRTVKPFKPQRTRWNPLPANLRCIVIDEASMLSLDYFEILCAAIPNIRNVQFIILGDLNQLPPVYGQAVLGKMLLEKPVVELTQVYRQALESPIIALALAVKDNRFKEFNADAVALWGAKEGFNAREVKADGGKVVLEREGRGKVTLHPWKVRWEEDRAMLAIRAQLSSWIDSGTYSPDEDLVLLPWNKRFGTIEVNKGIADKLAKLRKADVYEVIAGYQKYYYAVGDKLMVDKQEAIVLEISRNPKYLGKKPGPHSPNLDRWGAYSTTVTDDADDDLSNADIDQLLESMADNIEERTAEASHVLKIQYIDSEEITFISKSAILNDTDFAYATTVHKAQGSECRRVFFITHYCHTHLSRELTYTAITRAAEELYIIMTPMMLQTAARRPVVKGDNLAAKLEWYRGKLDERLEKKRADGSDAEDNEPTDLQRAGYYDE